MEKIECSFCKGSGGAAINDTDFVDCPQCYGSGAIPKPETKSSPPQTAEADSSSDPKYKLIAKDNDLRKDIYKKLVTDKLGVMMSSPFANACLKAMEEYAQIKSLEARNKALQEAIDKATYFQKRGNSLPLLISELEKLKK